MPIVTSILHVILHLCNYKSHLNMSAYHMKQYSFPAKFALLWFAGWWTGASCGMVLGGAWVAVVVSGLVWLEWKYS